jgi:N-acetylmuramoyl-L-alanine amidase
MLKSLARCTLAVVPSLAVATPLLAQDAPQTLIVIDAGHGGSDPGAKASTGVLEKDVTLAFAQQLADALVTEGATVEMIRTTDIAVSLENRTASADHAALLLSIHTAAAPTASSSGIRLYIPQDDPASERVAAVLAAQLLELGPKLRPTQQADFAVFRDLPCPAVMVELGHLTNADDAQLMTDPDFQHQATAAVVMALQAAGLVPAGE